MKLHSKNIKMTGDLVVRKFDEQLNLVEQIEVNNLVVTTGKEYIAQRIASNVTDTMSHMAIGSNNTTASLGNTQLIAQLGITPLDRVDVLGTVVTYSATFAPGVGTGNIVEAGIFNSDTAGIMLCRTTFPVIIKDPSTTISITWNISVG